MKEVYLSMAISLGLAGTIVCLGSVVTGKPLDLAIWIMLGAIFCKLSENSDAK